MRSYIFLLLLPFSLFAQKQKYDGYVLKLDGTKINCQLEIPEISLSQQQFRVYLPTIAEYVIIDSKNSLGFGIDKKDFHVRLMQTDLNLTSMDATSPKWETKKGQLLFMKVINEGPTNLFSVPVNQNLTYFFIAEREETVAEQLIHHVYSNGYSQSYMSRYVDQIYNAVGKEYRVSPNISYNEGELRKLFLVLNNSRDNSRVRFVEKKLSVGVSYSFPHNVVSRGNVVSFGAGVIPSIDGQLLIPQNQKKLLTATLLGLKYQYVTLTKSATRVAYYDLSSFSASNLFAYAGLQRKFSKRSNIQPLLNGGVGVNTTWFGRVYFDDAETELMRESSISSGDFVLSKVALGFFGSAGVKIGDKIGMELRYEGIPRYNARSKKIRGRSYLNQVGFLFSYYLN